MQASIPDNVWICRTSDEVEKIVADHQIVVVKLGATWCGPCKVVAPIYQQWAGQFTGNPRIAFLSVDIDQNPMYNEEIAAVPAFLFYINQKLRPDLMQLGADMQPVKEIVQECIEMLPSGEGTGQASRNYPDVVQAGHARVQYGVPGV